jgi:hypothetical protein
VEQWTEDEADYETLANPSRFPRSQNFHFCEATAT